jgi:hypothetical protein
VELVAAPRYFSRYGHGGLAAASIGMVRPRMDSDRELGLVAPMIVMHVVVLRIVCV